MKRKPVKLSVVIVSYNVKQLLKNCLSSVENAIAEAAVSAEVIVVDNHSADNSVADLSAQFPRVRFIANNENRGFAAACNQGLAVSSGSSILFLNPDTVINGESLSGCISFLEKNKEAGAVGVRMINEKAEYLKESKRGFPSPAASFFRLFGFSALFPRSKVFARYYLGHLDEKGVYEVDVLSGAFMMINKEALEKTGGFDERFFMYGEDIDLSYRLQQAGYRNYYLGGHTITHLKGKSTNKGELKYVKRFYKAMQIFAEKHFRNKSIVYFWILRMGIFLRMLLAVPAAMVRRIAGRGNDE